MPNISVHGFMEKHHKRISFVKLLVKNLPGIGLKGAKEKLDYMLDGNPIELEIDSNQFVSFQKELDELKLNYQVIE